MKVADVVTSRELDALIAVNVMGWTLLPPRWSDGNRSGYEMWLPDLGVKSMLREYSTDIAVAWQVVEYLKDTRHLRVDLLWGGDENPLWICELHSDGYRSFQDQSWSQRAETAPLAICRAALAAVGAA